MSRSSSCFGRSTVSVARSDAIQRVADLDHALVADGHVQCRGGNEHGQLGNGSIEGELDEHESPPSLIPDTPPPWVVASEPTP